MTTPNQGDGVLQPPSDQDLQGLLGQGAYTVSDSGNFGQSVTEDSINTLVYGPLSATNVAANSSSVTDVISVMGNLLDTIPVSTLKYLQPFIAGATDADFADSATASAFIVNAFIPKMVIDTTNWVTRLVTDLEILFDFFHITYPAGSPTDTATTTSGGKRTWYSAWEDLMELLGLASGTNPGNPAPTVGTSITSATDWVTRLMQDLEILFDVFHLTYNAGTSGDAPGTLGVGGVGAGKPTWYSAWNDVLALIGLSTGTTPTTPAPTIGTAIGTATTTATNASDWATRLTNDLLITSDVFHVVYNVGTTSDAPGTLGVGGAGAGKPTWYSAWNDLKLLTGTVNGVTAPTDAAPAVASAITTAQSAATAAGTAASSASTAAAAASAAATALQTDFTTSEAAFATLVASWYTTLTTGGQAWSTVLTDLDSAWHTYITANASVTAATSATITQLLGNLFGFDPSTGQMDPNNVAGLGDSFTQLAAALSGDATDAGDWAWLSNIMTTWFGVSSDAHSMSVDNTNTLDIRDNKPLIYGLDDTTESNIAFTDATTTINVTSTGTVIGFVRCQQTDNKNTIAFTANTTSAPTSFLVNLYKVDFANSRLLYINTSANLVSQLSSTEKWIFTTAGGAAVSPGDVLAIEFQVVGSGSINVYGKTLSKPTHPVAQLAGAAATRSGTPGGVQAALGFSGLSAPNDIEIDSSGNYYVTDFSNNRVVKLSGGAQTVLGFSGLSGPWGVAVDSSGTIYVTDSGHNQVVMLSGATQTTLGFTGLSHPDGIAVDSSGAIYVSDQNNNRVVKLVGGTQTVLGFTGLSGPRGVAVDSSGAVYVVDGGNNAVKKLVGGTQTTLGFTGLSLPEGVAVDSSGAVYVTSFSGNIVKKLVGATQTTLGFSGLSGPAGISVDASGNVYVADQTNNRVVYFSNNTAFTSLTFNNTSIPYVGLETSSPPPPSFPNHTTAFTTPGTTTQTIDTWVAHVDLVGVGGGGGGQGETGGTVGRGGSPGSWNTKTLVVGTDIPVGGLITITVGSGGAGGPYFTDGSAGTATVFSWVDPSGTTQTLTASAGAGGGLGNGSNLTTFGQGTSPASETYQGATYVGGAAKLTPGVGNVPGGSGTGGQPFQFGFAGARGQAWTVLRQS